MSEWKEYKLGDVISLHRGYDLPNSKRKDGDVPIVSSSGISDYHNSFKVLPPGVITGRYGTIGEIFYLNEPYWPLNTTLYVDDFKGNDPLFIYYFLKNLDFEKYNDKSTIPGINRNHLYCEDVKIPSLDEQKRIASILSSLDDKIDLLNRENETLEAMAETLFRQWFIEEAKEDWEEGTISDLIDFNPTRKLAKDTIAPFLEMSNLSTSTYAPTYWYDRAFSSGTKFQNGDSLLARITPCLENGKTAYVDFLNEGQIGWGSTEFIVMRSKMGLHPFFSYIVAKYQDYRDYAESCMAGSSGRQRVDIDNLKNYPISIPDMITINQFNAAIESFVSKMQINSKQIRNLKIQRDTLLPKLFSNEINIE